jgi:hypothetical protein
MSQDYRGDLEGCDVGRILKVTIISVHFKNKTAS